MKTKILYIHHAIGMGGAPRSLSFLISNLDPDQYEPIVLMQARPGNGAVKQLFEDAGAEVVEERQLRPFDGSTVAPCKSLKMAAYYLGGAIPTFWAVRKQVRAIQPDIVHLNSTCLFMAAAGSKWANKKIKTIAHVREPLQLNWWGNILAVMNRRYVDAFISIDRYGLSTVGAKKSLSFVIPNFVDRSIYRTGNSDRSVFRKQFGCRDEDVLFLCLARVASSNGQLELAEFLAQHQQQLPTNAVFVFCGFVERESEYARRSLAAIEKNDRAIAAEFSSDVVQLIDSSDVIVAPFITPHNARMVIEGSAMEKPSLVSDVPNLIEQIDPDKTGFVFSFQRPEELLDQIQQLSGDPELRRAMGVAAGDFAAQHYDDKTNSRRTIEVYEKLLGRKTMGSAPVASVS